MGKKLHVGNLSSSATDEDLLVMFGQCGVVESAKVSRDAQTGLSRGFGLVEMSSDVEADVAINKLNFTPNDGLIMSVSEARWKKWRNR